MDGSRFDDLARSLASARSRRSLLKLAGSAIGAAAATRFGTASAATSRGPGQICRKAADCDSSLCGPPDRTGRRRCLCPAGQQACNGACLDPTIVYQSDENNCGSCGRRCASGAVCCDGDCVPVVAVCRGVCCASNQVCAEAGCCTPQDRTVSCEAGCGNKLDNCGQAVDCGPCCAAASAPCEENGDCCSTTCVNSVCQSGPVANGGTCDEAADCRSETCCNKTCVDPASFLTDVDHCGSCGNACPGEVSECASPVCVEGGCSTTYAEYGTAVTSQTPGDCRKQVCDGAGGTTSIADDTDLPARTDSTCQVPTCSDGTVGSGQAPIGTPCDVDGGTLCNGSGQCVPCLIDEDCDGGVCLSDNTCCAPDAKEITCDGLCGEVTDNCGIDVDCGECCIPDTEDVTCDGQCGTVLNNCDESVDCGECCVPDTDDVTCDGQCGSVLNNCDEEVDCGACCVPDSPEVTCDGLCGTITNNCDEEIDCGECCEPEPFETTCTGQCGTVLNNCDAEVECGVCCDEGHEIGSDGETCVPTEETCNIPINRGDLVMSNYDFRECNFAGYEITQRYLNGADFTGANLAGAIFTKSNFSGADFTNANLTGVIWNLAVCPDDTLAADHGNSCCNNLNGAVPASC